MSDPTESGPQDSAEQASSATGGARPPLRRRLFGGYDTTEVEAELDRRESELSELRRDVASLWLAYTRGEQQLQQLSARVEALEGDRGTTPATSALPPPPAPQPVQPGPVASGPDPGAGSQPAAAEEATLQRRTDIRDQLSELDQVLAAIEQATATLETTYAEEIADPDEEPRAS